MPPVARSVGLMLVLAGPVCLAAQTVPPALAASHEAPGSGAGRPSLDQASREFLAAIESQHGDVEPAQEHKSVAVSPPGGAPPIPLAPPRRSNQAEGEAGAARKRGLPSLVTVASSLAIVLGLFFVVVWAMRRATPGGSVLLPSEVVEVLGRAALAGRAQATLLRCGNKLLLVSVSQSGVEPLTEITDPDEVTRLAGLCRQGHPGSTTAAFRQVFQQWAGQRSTTGFAQGGREDVRPASAGMAGTNDGALEGHDV